MRKSVLFGLMGALILVASCMREPEDLRLFQGELTLTAYTEQPAASRTVVESGTQVYWEPGDELAVFWGDRSSKFKSELSEPAATATFKGRLSGWKTGMDIWAVYPYTDEATFSEDCITTVLPSRQVARAGSFGKDMNLAVARSTNRTLQFYNVGGGVRFSVAEDSIKKVVFQGLNDEIIAGTVKVGFEDECPKVREVTGGSRFITILPPDGETFQKGNWYYIVAVPGSLEKGYKLSFYKGSVYAQRVSETAVTIKRSIYGTIENADQGLEYEPVPAPTEWTTEKTMRGVQYEENAGSGGEGGDGETGEIVQMPPNALFVMDDLNDLLISYDEDNWTITYRVGPALTEADIKVGDVLYSMPVEGIAPDGYTLRVVGIHKNGDRVTYDVEPAGISDAFEHLSTDIPIDASLLTEECITVYDILDQPDQSGLISDFDANAGSSITIPTRSIFDEWSVDLNAVTDTNKLKIKFDSEKASISYVLADGDKNLKTRYDQIRLVMRFEYGFDDCFHFEYDASRYFLSMEFSPQLGISGGFEYGLKGSLDQALDFLDIGDETPKVWDLGTLREMRAMQEKLMGKKIRICSLDLAKGVKAVKAVVRPTLDIYAYFRLSLEGNLEVAFGFEKTRWHLCVENIPYSIQPNLSKMLHLADNLTPLAKFSASADFKGSTGLGAGLVVRLPKLAEKISYKDPNTKEVQVPWLGFFVEWGLNAKASTKNWVDIPSGKLHTDLNVDVYNEVSGYLEAYAHFKNGLLFNPKVDLIKVRYPEESVYKYNYSWETETRYPTPILISPSNREAVEGNCATLQWKIPRPDKSFLAANEQFNNLKFYVYAGTDKDAICSHKESSVIGIIQSPNDTTRFDLQSINFPVENMKTYWWQVVCRNGKEETYESPLGTFDCGYDGRIVFDLDFSRWLSDHFEALGDVFVQRDGSILRTASNIKALASLKTLEIKDGGSHYHIKSIDKLLRNLPSLENLDCRNNTLSSLDLSLNPKLQSLVCNENQLSDLDLSNNKMLNNLSCKKNLLTDLNVNGLSLLENVSCSENPELETLVFSACPLLTTVSCPKCKISELDLSESYNLRDLYASENHLDSLDISRCPNLIRLDIYAQYKERVKLRLTQAQYDGFALFKRHFNTDFEFVGANGVEIVVSDITDHSATVTVTMLDRGTFTGVGLYYSILDSNPSSHSNPDYVAEKFAKGKLSESFTIDNLRADTGYYVRGYAFDANEMRYYLGNTIHIRTLQRDPAPELSIIPENAHFGDVDPGRTAYKDLVFKNTGEMDLTYEIPDPNLDPFSIKPYGQTTLHPGDSVIHTLAFSPKSSKEYDAYFTVKSNDYRGDQYIYANGKGSGNYHPEGIPDIVDMGLSVHWASFNLGATQPEERGAKFAWGETNTWRDHGEVTNPWAYYKWSDADDPDELQGLLLTKYCFDSDDGSDGFTDGKSVLDAEDDAAADYLGGYWRMPTISEWMELSDNCDIRWSSNVVTLTSKKNGKSIYLPITSYWSSSLFELYSSHFMDYRAASVSSHDESFNIRSSAERWNGLAIRPVFFIPIESVSLNESEVEISNFERDAELRATVTPVDAMNKHFVWETENRDITGYISREGGDTRTVSYSWAAGTANVTVYADDGKNPAKTATCRVVSKIYIEEAGLIVPEVDTPPGYFDGVFNLITGESITLHPKYYPENATEFTDSVQWGIDDTSIASISSNGVVKGVKPGETTVRVSYKSWNNTFAKASYVIRVSNPDGSHEGFEGENWD